MKVTKERLKYLKEWRRNHPNYHKVYSKKWREDNPHYPKNRGNYKENQKKWSRENPEKIKVYNITNKMKLRKSACEKCGVGNVRLEAHHPDYSNPNKIITLCVGCHKVIHL